MNSSMHQMGHCGQHTVHDYGVIAVQPSSTKRADITSITQLGKAFVAAYQPNQQDS